MPTGPTEGPQVWRRHRKGRPAPSPHDWSQPSAHLPWVLLGLCGKSCFVALGAQDSGPVPPPGPSPRACLLPGALLAFVREQGTGSKARGVSLLLGLLCPASRAQLSHSPPQPGGPLYLCSSERAVGSPTCSPPRPRPSLFPTLGGSQKLVPTLPATLS